MSSRCIGSYGVLGITSYRGALVAALPSLDEGTPLASQLDVIHGVHCLATQLVIEGLDSNHFRRYQRSTV